MVKKRQSREADVSLHLSIENLLPLGNLLLDFHRTRHAENLR
jgi:hypothetical protein